LSVIRKILNMKKPVIILLTFFLFCAVNAQTSKSDLLQNLEKSQTAGQQLKLTATTTAATRLFREKDDLTAVIMVIPKGSGVEVIGSDSTYFHVLFEENDGYILRRHAQLEEPADVSKPPVQTTEPVIQEQQPVQQEQPVQQQSRFSYLEDKYGSGMAARLIEGKIWKGMNSEMIQDSWGKPQKINRVISGNVVKEEWIYRNTWLYLEDDKLVEWGPTKN
jgi:hypothetical protein